MKKAEQTRVPVSDAELKEIERSTVLLAELAASASGMKTETFLAHAFDEAASSGATPFEVLKSYRVRKATR
jgi:hypothetical protein